MLQHQAQQVHWQGEFLGRAAVGLLQGWVSASVGLGMPASLAEKGSPSSGLPLYARPLLLAAA